MRFFYRLLRKDASAREDIISMTSALGIAANLLIAAVKVLLGVLGSSVAIVSEGVNNAADAFTSVLTLVGTRLAGKHPDRKHPFGYGRLEYMTGLVIAVLILVTGTEMLISSVKAIFNPPALSISYLSLAIVAGSAVLKYLLGSYTIAMGRKADSGTLEALGLDSRNDAFISLVTILSAVVFLVSGYSIDGYAGVIMSCVILKAGAGVLLDTIGELIGRPGEKELARQIYREVLATDGVLSAADMMLHNYGPDAWSGSVNVEIDHEKTVGEIYAFLHELQLRIMHEYKVTMVFGVYAVDNDHEDVRQIRADIAAFVKTQEHVKSFHAVYLDPNNGDLYCDLIVDYDLRDWSTLEEDFKAYMAERLPGTSIHLTIETEFV